MAELLKVGYVLKNRYSIKKVFRIEDNNNTYLVLDPLVTEKTYVLREFIFPDKLSKDKLNEIRIKIKNILDLIIEFKSKHIPVIMDYFSNGYRDYVVFEYKTVTDLKTLTEMSISGIKGKELLNIASDICLCLHSLGDITNEMFLYTLKPENVLIDTNKNLYMVNFDISLAFSDIAKDLKTYNLKNFAKTVFFLSTKRELKNANEIQNMNEDPEFISIIEKCYSEKASDEFRSFDYLKNCINNIISPPSAKEISEQKPVVKKPPFDLKSFMSEITVKNIIKNIFSQKLIYFAAEILVILLIVFGFIFYQNRNIPFNISGDTILTISDNGQLIAYDELSGKVKGQKRLNNRYDKIAVSKDGNFIFTARKDRPVLDTICVNNFKKSSSLAINDFTDNILYNPEKNEIYLNHPATNNISILSVPGVLSDFNKLTLLKIIPVRNNTSRPSYSKTKPLLFIPSTGSDIVTVIDLNNYRILINLSVSGGAPSSVIPADNGSIFYVSMKNFNSVYAYNLSDSNIQNKGSDTSVKNLSYSYIDNINLIGLKEPVSILLSKDKNQLFVLCDKTNTLGIIDIVNKKLMKNLSFKFKPLKMILSDNNKLIILLSDGEILIIDTLLQKVIKSIKPFNKPVDICYKT